MGTEKKLTLTYALPGEKEDAVFTYRLVVFKQPGTLLDPFTFSLSHPKSFTSHPTTPDIVKQESSISTSEPLKEDKVITSRFSRKK